MGCGRPVNVRPKGGDASACLIVRPPVDRRSLNSPDINLRATLKWPDFVIL
jgi:hypothetical protein